uniref:Zn(2)-C6 fungal-type domain-containing protein n=1 Tax=Kwoniella bestiolae CBS 10118 TaxID=1296100 RepID=A0A1B9FWN9_9TREE|nr:hypothetical protein I302_07532 [Kwoniella bestiolae CBS 10118]OCF23179.1 hypothetical protein I302_07532 [Kwoniella bestiolae CBS 10118]
MSFPYESPSLPQHPSRPRTLPQPIPSPTRQSSSSSIMPAQAASGAPPTKKTKKRPSFSEHTVAEGTQDLTKVRAYAACRNCRTKKIRCLPGPPSATPSNNSDNGGPVPGTCQQCIQAGIECTYPPTRDRAAYSRQYVQNLEARVQALEAMQARVIPLLEAYENTQSLPLPLPLKRNNGIITAQAALVGEVPVHVLESEGESQEDEVMQGSGSDVEDGGQMTQDERGNYRYIGSSNTLSLLDSFSHRDRERERKDDIENPAQGGPMSRSNSFAIRSNTQLSDPTSRQSPAISDHTARGPNPYFSHVAGSGVVKALPPVHEVQYPPPEEASKMIDAFFEEVHPSLPVVIEHEFRKEFKDIMDARARGALPTQGPFLAVVFAMFALGERVLVTSKAWQRERKRIQDDAEGDEDTVLPGEAEAGVIWYERAQILHYTSLKDIDINQVQCLTLMAAFQASVNAMPMSWLLAGQALRVAQDLGLHRSTSRLPIPFAEKQLRSRCWWAIYGLERMMSISLGRPLGVDDLDIDVAYPAEVDDEGLERLAQDGTPSSLLSGNEEPLGSTMSGFIALTKLCKIAGKVAHLLYRPSNERSVADPSWAASQQTAINKVDKLLREWLDHDPLKYKDPSDNRAVSLVSAILSNSYFAVLITLHRNFLPSNPDYPRPKPPPSSQSLARCVEAARSVIHIASQSRTLVPPSHHLAVYCQYLWSSAIILLLCEVQAKDQLVIETVGSHVESCRRTLQCLEPVWPGSRKLKELLNDVASRAKEVAQVSKVNNPRSKKRKAISLDRIINTTNSSGTSGNGQPQVPGQMRPPPSRNQSSSASPHRPNIPSVNNSDTSQAVPGAYQSTYVVTPGTNTQPEKRQRTYETSDTRTLIIPENTQQQQLPQVQNTYFNNNNIPPYTSSTPTPTSAHVPDPMDIGVYDSFDLGGVSFNPSELLQGFSDSASASNFWNQMTFIEGNNGQTQTQNSYNSAGGQGQQVFSGQNTPNSAGGATSGPSPGIIPQNSGVGGYDTIPTQGGVDPFAEFWAQVAGNTFDWQADPSVPFNI